MKKLSFKTKVLSLALVAGVAAMAGAFFRAGSGGGRNRNVSDGKLGTFTPER